MRRFLGSNRSLFPKIAIAVSAITLVSLAASGAFASSQRTTAPASARSQDRPNAPAETIQQCLKKLVSIQEAANRMEKLRKDVLAKRTYLYTIGRLEGQSIFVPVSALEFKYFLTQELSLGGISPSQLVRLVREVRQMTAENLRQLEEWISDANDKAQKQKKHCDALRRGGTTTTPKPPPPPPAGTFTLRPALTDVKNPNANELTINAIAGTAVNDHTGPNGGAGKGGEWKTNYSWKVPQTITPGKTSQITIGLEIGSVNPSQPLLQQIGAFAPDFVGAVDAHYPDRPKASKTFDYDVRESQSASSDIAVTIGMLSATVTYHYRK